LRRFFFICHSISIDCVSSSQLLVKGSHQKCHFLAAILGPLNAILAIT